MNNKKEIGLNVNGAFLRNFDRPLNECVEKNMSCWVQLDVNKYVRLVVYQTVVTNVFNRVDDMLQNILRKTVFPRRPDEKTNPLRLLEIK